MVVVVLSGVAFGAYTKFIKKDPVEVPASSTPTTTTTTNETTKTEDTTKQQETVSNIPVSENCGITKNVTEGPYYVSGTGQLTNGNLNYSTLAGTPVVISGHVYGGADGNTPVANAKIELWQADDGGNYHPNGNGTLQAVGQSNISLRGYIVTNSAGEYTFSTIYPGYYEGRARHIHFKASADGFASVTSQLIFYPKAGDGVTYSTDSIAQSLPSCNLIKVDESVSPETGHYDIRLQNN